MAKKDITPYIIIGVVIIIVALIIAPKLNFGGFKTVIITNTTIIEILKYAPAGTCTASINPPVVYIGDLVTGTVTDGVNTRCQVYANSIEPYSPDWREITEGITNNAGVLTFADNIEILGVFNFRAICGDCVTNTVTLTVNPLPDEDDGEPVICYDSDATLSPFEEQLKTAAYCTDSTGTVYDSCITGYKLTEWYCGPLGDPPELRHCMGGTTEHNCPGYIPGSICSSGRCVMPAPLDTDGDGYSDADEITAGTNPNDPYSYPGGGPAEFCANYCKNINYAGSKYYSSGGSLAVCQAYFQDACPNIHGLPYEASTYSVANHCCCGDCVGW